MDIQSVIIRHGISKAELARKMETSASYITQLVSGQSTPSMKMLDKLASIIGCKRWEFFLDEMDREEVMAKLGIWAPLPQESLPGEQKKENELPFGAEETSVPASLICPHCGTAFIVEVKERK